MEDLKNKAAVLEVQNNHSAISDDKALFCPLILWRIHRKARKPLA